MSTLKVTNIKAADGTSALSIADSTGNVSVTGKVFAPNGIVFSSTELTGDDASTTTRTESSNLLDDYEEGEVQYPLTLGTTVHTGGFGNKSARYIKIGNFVHYYCHFDTATNTLSATGDVKINLPFTSFDSVTYNAPRVFWKTLTYENTTYYNRTLYLIEGTSELLLYNDSFTGQVSASSTSDLFNIRVSITYQT